MKKIVACLLTMVALLSICGCGTSSDEKSKSEAEENKPKAWDTTFAEAGFSESEIAEYREILNPIGVTDFHDVSIIDNGPMTIVRGTIYDADDWQLNMTLENHKVIYIGIAGIPDTETEAYINWRGKLKLKRVNTTTTVDMFSDTEGGYLAVLDWENKTFYEYGTQE